MNIHNLRIRHSKLLIYVVLVQKSQFRGGAKERQGGPDFPTSEGWPPTSCDPYHQYTT